MRLRARMVNLGLTGVDMIKLLAEKGIYSDQAEFSKSINYKLNYPKNEKIRTAVIDILNDLERK